MVAQILEHLKAINFLFGTNGKLMVLGVPIFKHFRALAYGEIYTHRKDDTCTEIFVSLLVGGYLQRIESAPEFVSDEELSFWFSE